MGKFGLNVVGAVGVAGITAALLSSTAIAQVNPFGTFGFNPTFSQLTPNTTTINSTTTAKTLVSPSSVQPTPTGNMGVAAGQSVSFTPTTISVVLGPISPAWAVSVNGFTFTFTANVAANIIP